MSYTLRADIWRLVFAVKQHHLPDHVVVAGADEAGGVSEVEIVVAVEDDYTLLASLQVEDHLLKVVRDHLSGALGPETQFILQSIDMIHVGP